MSIAASHGHGEGAAELGVEGAVEVVVFDLDTLGSLRSGGPDAPPVLRPYPYLTEVLSALAASGRRLGLWWSTDAVNAERLPGALAAAGIEHWFDEDLQWPTKPGETLTPLLPRAGSCLLISEDSVVRGRALEQGWKVAPHPLLAAALLSGQDAWFVQITAPAALDGDAWRVTLRSLPVVPLRVTGDGGRVVTAITVDSALAVLANARFEVRVVGERGDPLGCDLYLLRDDERDQAGSLTGAGQFDQLFGPDNRANQALVLSSSDEGILVRLPFDRSIEELHFATAAHGHNLKLLPDPGLLSPAPEATLARRTMGLAPDRDPTPAETAALAGITDTRMKAVLDRYAGAAPLGDAAGTAVRSRHILHPDNQRATAQLVADLQAIGGGALRVSTHAFTHNGRTHHNVEAELAGTGSELVLVTAHLDSTAASSPPYAPAGDPAPGADDDGSGVAAVLTAAAVMVGLAATRPPERTIRFVLFNAEEHGLIGSQAYARDAHSAGADIEAVFQIDMIGYNVAAPRTCEIHAGYLDSVPVQAASAAVAERVRRLAAIVSPTLDTMQLYLSSPGAPDPAEGRSDHAPFQDRGYAACVATEDFFAGPGPSAPAEANPNYHRKADTFVDLVYAADITRSVAAAAWITAQPTQAPEPPGGSPMSIRIASGATPPGSTNWQPYSGDTGVFLDVDTSAGKFTTTPNYLTSLGGTSSHWATTGATSIYNATPTGFRVYVRWSNGTSLTPAQANSFQWHINWVGVEP